MRKLLFAALFASVFAAGCSADATVLPTLKGQYRVIAVFAENADRTTSLTNAFKSSPGLDERDIAWFVVGPDRIESNLDDIPDRDRLEKLHTVDGFQAVLVGKDGTIKASQLGGLDIQELLNSIDQMPMRQQEMQQQ